MDRGLTKSLDRGASRDPAPPSWRVERLDGGLRFSGRFRTPDALAIVTAVRDAAPDGQPIHVELDSLDQIDGGVIALLRADFAARGVQPTLHGGDRFRSLFDLYAKGVPSPRRPRERGHVAAEVGRATLADVAELENVLAFVGNMSLAIGRLVRRAGRANWKELPSLIERAGFDALPVVLLINFLIGFVTAYMSTIALTKFGANIYVADLVGIAMTRQLGPLLTAFVVCGRSGAAYATEIGSMKVSEEIDALRTTGLEPYGWLAVPRVLALVIVVPVITLLSDLVGIAGGLVVATTSLGLTLRAYLNETREAVAPWDVESGLCMSLAFAIAIGLIACQQGFAAGGGPLGVGRRTTNTVVASLFAVVLLDTLFTVLYRFLDLS